MTFQESHLCIFSKVKTEVLKYFKEFKAFAENQEGKYIKVLRTDNCREYINNTFKSFLKSCGIWHQLTVSGNPEQNGVAERLNRTLVKTRAMLIDSGLSKNLWAEPCNTANYLRNRCPTKAVKKMIPEEAWSKCKPDLLNLRIFSCTA